MDDPALPRNDDRATSEPEAPTGRDWQEFFRELGQGTQATEAVSQETTPLRLQERVLYASENGDRWSLARGTDTGRIFVRHGPNLASGGQTSDMHVGEFLARGGMGPEKQELLRLIGSIVEGAEVNA